MRLALILLIAVFSVTAMSLAMTMAWLVQQTQKTSRWVDASWSAAVGVVALFAALLPLDGNPGRELLVAGLAAMWSCRLTLHLVARNKALPDDPRYRKLAEEWGKDASLRMFWFLQSQAMVGIILVLAIGLAAHHPAPGWRLQDGIGAALLVLAIAGEALADRQLAAFRRDFAGQERVCDRGLWRWSRHPNYFFEWLGWTAFAVFAADFTASYPWGWLGLAAPAVMYWALVHVSGLPPLEAHMLRTRGEAYRRYQAQVSPFWLWPPKPDASGSEQDKPLPR